MSSSPMCRMCGDYIHHGPVLCGACDETEGLMASLAECLGLVVSDYEKGDGTYGVADDIVKRARAFCRDKTAHYCKSCDKPMEYRVGVMGTPYWRCWPCGVDEDGS